MSATVLMVHNHYQMPGGEDQVFRAESDLLETRGHPRYPRMGSQSATCSDVKAGSRPSYALELRCI